MIDVSQYAPYQSNHSAILIIPKLPDRLVPLMAVIPLMVVVAMVRTMWGYRN